MLKPEISIPVALATGVLVWSIYQNATPSYLDLRAAPANDKDVAAAEKLATWTAAGAVSAISLIAKDPVVFMVGGAMVIINAWWTRHGNRVNPMTGKATQIPVPAADNMPPDVAYEPA